MDVIIYLAAAGFAVMGLAALVKPDSVPRLFGISTIGADMANEIRAVYGGFGCAVSALLIVASGGGDLSSGIVITIGVALLGMAAGRVVSFVLSRELNFYPVLFFGLETLFAVLLLMAGWHRGAT